MANNIVVGDNIGIGIGITNLNDIPALNSQSVLIIKKLEGASIKTWKKGRSLNPLQAISIDGQYNIKALQPIDLTAYFATKAADFTGNVNNLTTDNGEQITTDDGQPITLD